MIASRASRVILAVLFPLILAIGAGAQTSQDAQALPDIVAKVRPGVAFVLANGEPRVSGSAFVVNPNGFLVTALHVIEDASEVSITFPGGQPQPASVIRIDTADDLALLQVGQTGLTALGTAASDNLRVGEEVIVIGYPLAPDLGSSDVTVTRGIVSALRTQRGLIQVDASMNPGVSGGPVLSARGEVIGVAVSGIRNAQGVNFAAPSNAVTALLAKALASLPAAEPLTLPLTTTKSVDITFQSGGIGGGPTKFVHGLSCIQPPENAKALSSVQGELNSDNALNVVTWLSLGGGGNMNGRNTFAYIDGIKQTHAVVTLTSLNIPPEEVCLNYGAANVGFFPLGLTFKVNYTLSFRIRPSASPQP